MSHPSDAFTSIVHPEVKAYVRELPPPDDPLIAQMEAYAAERGFPLVGRDTGRVMELLTASIGGRRVFEFGSGWGFSAFFFARAVGEGGEVLGCDKDAHELEAHERLFAGHPLKPRIRLYPGDAFAVFDSVEGSFDVIFLDLHKRAYPDALAAAIPRLRRGGLLLADNVLWGGKAARDAADDADTAALQEFNRLVFRDPRLQSAILPVGDGLAVCRVR